MAGDGSILFEFEQLSASTFRISAVSEAMPEEFYPVDLTPELEQQVLKGERRPSVFLGKERHRRKRRRRKLRILLIVSICSFLSFPFPLSH